MGSNGGSSMYIQAAGGGSQTSGGAFGTGSGTDPYTGTAGGQYFGGNGSTSIGALGGGAGG